MSGLPLNLVLGIWRSWVCNQQIIGQPIPALFDTALTLLYGSIILMDVHWLHLKQDLSPTNLVERERDTATATEQCVAVKYLTLLTGQDAQSGQESRL